MMQYLPAWARPDPTMLGYLLRRGQTLRGAIWQQGGRVFRLLVALGIAGCSAAVYLDNSEAKRLGTYPTSVFSLMYAVLIFLQFSTWVGAFVTTSEQFARDLRHDDWELVWITMAGTRLLVRAHWAAVFWRGRLMILTIMLPRLVWAGLFLVDLTGVWGFHPGFDTMEPAVPTGIGILLVLINLAAALIEPLVLIGLSAALGVYVSALIQHRWAALLARIIIFIIALFFFCRVSWIGFTAMDQIGPSVAAPAMGRQQGLLLMTLFGDHGLWMVDPRLAVQLWHQIDGSLWFGLPLLLLLGCEIILMRTLLCHAASYAEYL
ncbi:MAG TPA: hypothetical protein VHP83_09785 [Aggregatilineaceae bacterium]|nr:hypothetical protein [Aggregatilineaceae bacterium]